MPVYNYQAADQRGAVTKGRIDAATFDVAGEELQRQGLIPLEIRPVKALTATRYLHNRTPHWPLEEKILFTRKFASLIKAGIPLLASLEMVAQQAKSPRVVKALAKVGDAIANGKTLHSSMAVFPSLFDPVYLGCLRAGEATGRLDGVLDHMAAFLEREMDTRRKIREALRYPVMVVAAIAVACAVVLKFVVPQFMAFYQNYGGTLPAPTRALMFASELAGRLWWLVFPLAGSIWAAWWWAYRTPRGQLRRDRIFLGLPLAGTLILKMAVSRFARLFSVLYSAGIPATTALETVAEGVGNRIVADEVVGIGRRLSAGGAITETSSEAVIPKLVYQMIGIGFESGEVDRMLMEVARHYEQEIDYDVRKIADQLQPILLLFLAAGVLALALAVLLPLWNLATLFRT